MDGDIVWGIRGEFTGAAPGRLRSAFARAAAFVVAQSASRGFHLGWLERRLAAVWTPGAGTWDGGAGDELSLSHTDRPHQDSHSDRSHTDRHSDKAGKHVDVPAEPGHYDKVHPHMDSHTDIPAQSRHTDKPHTDVFGDLAVKRKLPPKNKKRTANA